jgi:hypothetical protein
MTPRHITSPGVSLTFRISIFSISNSFSVSAVSISFRLVLSSSKNTVTVCVSISTLTFDTPSTFLRTELAHAAVPSQVIPGIVSFATFSSAEVALKIKMTITRDTSKIKRVERAVLAIFLSSFRNCSFWPGRTRLCVACIQC